jgi:hypothetical protein
MASRARAAAANGVPLDEPDDLGETALMHAAAAGHTEVVKVLLLAGVDTNVVSSLGQTAVEMASARGHGDVVALLQKEARPPRPPGRRPGRRPSARRWLLGSALAGATLVVGYNWVYSPWPTQISFEEVKKLVQAKGVKSLTAGSGPVKGEVKAPLDHPNLARGRFWADVPATGNAAQELRRLDPTLQLVSKGPIWESNYRPPPAWGIGLLLGGPALVAALAGWPVGGRHWFPMLRPPRRA